MRVIGLMSGTSLDGVDGVLASFDESGGAGRALAHAHRPMPAALRSELLALQTPGPDELHRSQQAAAALADLYADVVADLLNATGLTAKDVAALGAHGQTVRHCPPGHPALRDGEAPYTVQLLDAARLAERTGLPVVADLRSRDVAAGGQGAPLVPAFHRAAFGVPAQAVAVVNIGGIANATLLRADGQVRGFDTGPGNVLLDGWYQRHTGQPFDADGAWGRQGAVDEALLRALLADPWLQRRGARSTGRDRYNLNWLDGILAQHPQLAPVNVQATLAAFTVETVARALLDGDWGEAGPGSLQRVLVCGGGARNRQLMNGLSERLWPVPVEPTDLHGWPAEQVEAAAFAWLAAQHLRGHPGNVPEVTGAAGPRILGALYPA
ncbi:Anhydro-N-acetylmuramic acid kinase [Tepidimonas alkaliphilus]|uniref:Anhydro-N-acetylmuramic acid kinase n=1 Tax=Tepidimonas alkaliphilus TaxID=2588942 RepID=A0A554W989_9BURK|nr:anhydro-N-acetylmuramic acid kinase [Tepidimonas alkaliphilus]TSE20143.1 Anhydro-N-acetylmuramic acid kinase [Tepidimonas alkaliphilus]